MNIHLFILPRHLILARKKQYENVDYPVPGKNDIDAVMAEAENLIRERRNIKVPVDIQTPRGRHPKNASKILRIW